MTARSGRIFYIRRYDIVQLQKRFWKDSCVSKIIQDGDQVSVKGIYSEEANKELIDIINSRRNLLGLDAKGVRTSEKEAILSMYSLTRILDEDKKKITSPVF